VQRRRAQCAITGRSRTRQKLGRGALIKGHYFCAKTKYGFFDVTTVFTLATQTKEQTMYMTHYTENLETLLSIIKHGLVFFPNDRRVFSKLQPVSAGREAQCRGMISFTDRSIEASAEHRKRYGQFGIALDKSWVISQGGAKVFYIIENSPPFNAFRSLFSLLQPKLVTLGDENLDQWVLQVCTEQKEFATSSGNAPYAELLTLHEFMQTDEHVAESEWRVMRNHKFSYSEGMSLRDVKKYCLQGALCGIFPPLQVSYQEAVFLICPQESKDELYQRLNGDWRKVELYSV
jgi:hypothetical protein